MQVNYRPALAADIPAMTDLFLGAVSDLYRRNNLSTPVPPQAAVLVGYEHVRSTGIFHVAEMEGEIVAIAGAILRDHLWYLSTFWAHPERQRQGVGMPYWSEQTMITGRQVLHNRQVAGYYYLGRGVIGPAAWTAPEHAEPVLALALGEAAQSTPTIRLAIPGMNHAGLHYAVGAGFRLTGYSHFLTTAPFGHLEQYVPSGPSLF